MVDTGLPRWTFVAIQHTRCVPFHSDESLTNELYSHHSATPEAPILFISVALPLHSRSILQCHKRISYPTLSLNLVSSNGVPWISTRLQWVGVPRLLCYLYAYWSARPVVSVWHAFRPKNWARWWAQSRSPRWDIKRVEGIHHQTIEARWCLLNSTNSLYY
jgi:hypothetical protein